ncbi:MAG: hypothetical protein H0X42_06340 [Solirubrobacterales bacterium]|nr:hypothetical protein [Solirubrobacterales bacterium]
MIGEENTIIATFTKAKCKVTKSGSGKSIFIKGRSTDGKYILDAAILHEFNDFKEYPVRQGPGQEPDILLETATETSPATEWGSQFLPSFPVPGGGAINFAKPNGKPGTGHLVGIGFGPAMWARDGASAVVLAGVLECQYKKKRGKL